MADSVEPSVYPFGNEPPQVDPVGAHPEKSADALVAALEAEGELRGEGRFQVDRKEAARKVRDHQLPDPTWYVLELVQAAVARGATRIAIGVDARGLEFACDGDPFSAAELEGRDEAIFCSDAAGAGGASLAVGLNVAMGLGPEWVCLSTGDGERGRRLTLRPGVPETLEEVRIEEVACSHERGFSVKVRLASRMGRFRRARLLRKARLPEALLVTERCVHARVSVSLGDRELAAGLSPVGAAWPVAIQGEGFAGVGAFVEGSSGAAQVRLVHQGVWLETVELGGLSSGFVAVITAEGLRKDISRIRFHRDAAYEARRLAAREARRGSLRLLASELARDEENDVLAKRSVWARSLVREALRVYAHPRDFEGLYADDTAPALALAPVFPLCDGEHPGGQMVPIKTLLERMDRGEPLGYVLVEGLTEPLVMGAAFRTGGPSAPCVVLVQEGDARHMRRLFGEALSRDEAWEAEVAKVAQRQLNEAGDDKGRLITASWASGVGVGLVIATYLLLGLFIGAAQDDPDPKARRTPEVQALEDRCGSGNAEACADLGRGYEEGVDPFPQSGRRARWYFQSACFHGHAPSCARSRSPSEVLGETLGCTVGRAEACHRLSERYRQGDGVVRDLALAKRYRQEACARGHGVACGPLSGKPDQEPRGP